jgi:hypothetical protein
MWAKGEKEKWNHTTENKPKQKNNKKPKKRISGGRRKSSELCVG